MAMAMMTACPWGASLLLSSCEMEGLGIVGKALGAISWWRLTAFIVSLLVLTLYIELDFHIVGDALRLFRPYPVRLVFNPKSRLAKEILSKCSFAMDKFKPTPWMCSPHLQTFFLHRLSDAPMIAYRRELLRTKDGGTIALDWADPMPLSTGPQAGKETCQSPSATAGAPGGGGGKEKTPLVIIVPGYLSSSRNAYIRRLVHACISNGWRAVVINHRGLGGVSLTSTVFYNAGWTDDLRFALSHSRKLHPDSPILAVGTSLGANILVKYMGEEGREAVVTAAVAVSCPFDLLVCDRHMGRSALHRLYSKMLTHGLKALIHLHKEKFSQIADYGALSKALTVREFDDRLTRIGKFETVDTYYRKCSSSQYILSVARPLLCISALDDPICSREAIPWDECKSNPNVILATTKRGGHLAHFEGFRGKRLWWMKPLIEFLAAALTSSSIADSEGNDSDTSSPLPSPQMPVAQ